MYAFLANITATIFARTAKNNMWKSEPELAPQIEKAREAIDNICQLMPGDSTSDNWRKSFAKMKTSLEKMPDSHGLEQAKETWDGIHGGMGSWNDYYIPHEDRETMTKLNGELASFCSALSSALSGN